MIELISKRKSEIIYKSLILLLGVVSAVALPQVFHLFGIASGLGSKLGQVFLPMHIPVLLAGLFGGPVAGLLAGLISPSISYGLTAMPTNTLLPFMTVELAFYGLTIGLLRKTKMPVIVKLLIAQVAGRLFRAGAIILAIYAFNFNGIGLKATYDILYVGLFGIALQLVLIPLLHYRFKNLSKY